MFEGRFPFLDCFIKIFYLADFLFKFLNTMQKSAQKRQSNQTSLFCYMIKYTRQPITSIKCTAEKQKTELHHKLKKLMECRLKYKKGEIYPDKFQTFLESV